MSQTSNFERLPKDVTPINYDIELEPDLKEFTFKGHAIIDVQVIINHTLNYLNII
jgi:hypothetical protein